MRVVNLLVCSTVKSSTLLNGYSVGLEFRVRDTASCQSPLHRLIPYNLSKEDIISRDS
jgi:hypothetical protein